MGIQQHQLVPSPASPSRHCLRHGPYDGELLEPYWRICWFQLVNCKNNTKVPSFWTAIAFLQTLRNWLPQSLPFPPWLSLRQGAPHMAAGCIARMPSGKLHSETISPPLGQHMLRSFSHHRSTGISAAPFVGTTHEAWKFTKTICKFWYLFVTSYTWEQSE